MKTTFFTLLLCLFSFVSLSAQDLMVYGGLNSNKFCDYQKNNNHFSTLYASLSGFNMVVGLDKVKIAHHSFLFTLRMSNYKGVIYTINRTPDQVTTTGIEINKNVIGLGVYPFNFKILDNKLHLSLGAECNARLSVSTKGYQSTTFNSDLKDRYTAIDNTWRKYVNPIGVGLSGRLAYQLKLKNNLYLMPQYTLYFGLTNELKHQISTTQSVRHLLEIGLVKKLNFN